MTISAPTTSLPGIYVAQINIFQDANNSISSSVILPIEIVTNPLPSVVELYTWIGLPIKFNLSPYTLYSLGDSISLS